MTVRISTAVQRFLSHREARNLSPESIRLYRTVLTQWMKWQEAQGTPDNLTAVSAERLIAYLTYLRKEHIPHQGNPNRPPAQQQGLSAASVDTVWRVLRAFWTFVCEVDAVGDMLNERQRLMFKRGAVPRPKVPIDIRPYYDQATLDALLNACDHGTREQRARNRCMLHSLIVTGMRVAEIASLRDENINLHEQTAIIIGKGGDKRYVFGTEESVILGAEYLAVRRGPWGGPFYRGVGSRNMGGQLTADAIRSEMKRIAKRAGIELIKGAPVHAIRHAFAHQALDAKLDISRVQQLLGHADIATTQRYLRERPERLREFHQAIWLPRLDKAS